MVDDFRSERMATPEGKGLAKGRFEKAVEGYVKGVNKVTGSAGSKLAKRMGAATAVDLIGFWFIWQTEGGFEGLQRLGMSRSAIYRRISQFRKHMGIHPDEYEMPGVTIDIEAYQVGTGIPRVRENRERALAEVEAQVAGLSGDPERSSAS